MRRRSGIGGLASNPILVGAVTVIIVIVAVFLAYNANSGLPFVPTYKVTAQVPNAEALVDGNEVRVGGVRVGLVEAVEPERLADGRYAARVRLSLDETVKPLPVDTTVTVRNKSAIGLKYVELNVGDSRKSYPEGAVLPLSAAQPETVELDQLFNVFDEETRTGVKKNLAGFGNALAFRGADLNAAFAELPRLLRVLAPAARNLVSPETDFAGFWRSLENISAVVAPVAETNAELFVNLDRTFGAFARVAFPYIQETISKSPPTEDEAIRSLPVMRPFLRNFGDLFVALRPGARALARTSPTIAAAFQAGVPVLNASPVLNAQLEPTARALVAFQDTEGVVPGLEALTRFNQALDPPLRFITPAQSICNYLTLLFRNAGSFSSQGNSDGTWLRAVPIGPPQAGLQPGQTPQPLGPNNEGSPSSAPADGPDRINHLHYNPYPNTAAPGQPLECEAGNERFVAGQTVIGNSPGTQSTITNGQTEGQLRRGGNE